MLSGKIEAVEFHLLHASLAMTSLSYMVRSESSAVLKRGYYRFLIGNIAAVD